MNLFVFGFGYSALHYVRRHRHEFVRVIGTVRTSDKRDALVAEGIETVLFDDPRVAQLVAEADDILVSAGPEGDVDPALDTWGDALAAAPLLRRIVYLSTVGVYGDHCGEWIDEDSETRPVSRRSVARLKAEKRWRALARRKRASVHVLRLAGIYGPGRNGLRNLLAGRARRLVKPGQVFNRIHVDDIAATIAACFARAGEPPEDRVWNVADDEPAPPQDVVAYGAMLLGIEPPPEQDFETAELTPMARSFYGENKRVSNRRLRNELRVELVHPTYREGFEALLEQGEGAPRDAPAVVG